jgi:hypothetical protein
VFNVSKSGYDVPGQNPDASPERPIDWNTFGGDGGYFYEDWLFASMFVLFLVFMISLFYSKARRRAERDVQMHGIHLPPPATVNGAFPPMQQQQYPPQQQYAYPPPPPPPPMSQGGFVDVPIAMAVPDARGGAHAHTVQATVVDEHSLRVFQDFTRCGDVGVASVYLARARGDVQTAINEYMREEEDRRRIDMDRV